MGLHLLTCKLGGSPIWAHDSMVSAWSSCFQNVSVHHKVEPRDQYLRCLNRPDISVFDSSSNANIDLDISLAHPWAKEVLKRSATDSGYAASKHEELKRSKYQQVHPPSGNVPMMNQERPTT